MNEIAEARMSKPVKKSFWLHGTHYMQLHNEDRSVFVVLSMSWRAANDGSAFSRNYRSVPADVLLKVEDSRDPANEGHFFKVVELETTPCRYKNDAMKEARALVREHGLRQKALEIFDALMRGEAIEAEKVKRPTF